MAKIDRFLKAVKEYKGSDLHLLAGTVPKIRIHGQLQPLEMPVITNEKCTKLLLEILTDSQKIRFLQKYDIDFAYEVPGIARFRVNFFMQRQGIGGVFRIIPTDIKQLTDLGIPTVIVPYTATAHSAYGFVCSNICHHLAASYYFRNPEDPAPFNAIFSDLEQKGRALLSKEGVPEADMVLPLEIHRLLSARLLYLRSVKCVFFRKQPV